MAAKLVLGRKGRIIPLMALRFPSNVSGGDQSAPYAVIEYANPHLNGLPMWGPSNQGVTLFRRLKYHQQTGYYANWWYLGHQSSFTEAAYWGAHPYPTTADNTGTSHKHEISAEQFDYTTTRAGGSTSVVKEEWRIEAIRAVRNGASSKTLTYYVNLPSVADGDVVECDLVSSNYGESAGPSPKLVIGDSPWYAGYQHERASCDLAEQLIVAKALTQAEIVTQAANLQDLTAASQDALWWWKKNYSSVDDLTCDGGTGRSFARNDASNLITLVTI